MERVLHRSNGRCPGSLPQLPDWHSKHAPLKLGDPQTAVVGKVEIMALRQRQRIAQINRFGVHALRISHTVLPAQEGSL
jgi:hypothetical protein